jgi:hypothetical protein
MAYSSALIVDRGEMFDAIGVDKRSTIDLSHQEVANKCLE